jgi:ubiquinone/menaquinone biosynthesis C-methylase UbiE
MHPHPTPARFFDAVNSFAKTAALKAAIELDFFTAIGEGTDTAPALAARCSVAERGARILCDFLTVHGLLTKYEASYALTPDSEVFLSRHSPAYLGGTTEFLLATQHFEAFSRLTQAVRQGGTAESPLGSIAPEHPMWVAFARSMAPMTTMAAPKIAELVNAAHPGGSRVLDIAAGHGMFGITVGKANPQAHITALDWANVLEVAKENAQKAGITDRFSTVAGSAFDVEYGAPYDAILITNFLHHFDVPTCETFLRKVHAALAPGGHAVTLEFVPNDDRVTPPMPATFSLTMLASTPAGDAYTRRELDSMLRNAGFGDSEFHPLEGEFQSIVFSKR